MESLDDQEDWYSSVAPVGEKNKLQFIATEAVGPYNKQYTHSLYVIYLWVVAVFLEVDFDHNTRFFQSLFL